MIRRHMKLYQHQTEGLEAVKDLDHVAFYWDMGLGKTYAGSEKMVQLGAKVNLVVCQKSKIDDWIDHFKTNYGDECIDVWDLTKKNYFEGFFITVNDLHLDHITNIAVINYVLGWRSPELL